MLSALTARLGREQAILELKWLKQAAEKSNVPLADLVRRRTRDEPLQYILGSQPFGPLNLLARPPVLIPRPETEDWTIRLSESLSPSPRRPLSLLDLGTGTGCIPLLLCHLWPQGSLNAHGVDISPEAIALSTENATLCGFHGTPSPDKNTFNAYHDNFLSPSFPAPSRLKPPFDILTSNPPYIAWDEYLELPESVSGFEDPKALFGGPSGLDFYHAIARLVARRGFLNPDAFVALEVGHKQAGIVEEILRTTGGVKNTEIWLDPWGKGRTVIGRL